MTTSEIVSFYKDQTIFLTGGSGFFGKVLIVKLLTDCPDVRKIFLLLRPKKGKSSQERLNELYNFACFDKLKAKRPDLLEKVILINGNCLEPNLGLSPDDAQTIISETTIVIYAAANVKFDQTLKEAVGNVRATRDILQVATKMPKLQVFVFISTAYSNCIRPNIEEKFYEPPISSTDLINLVDRLNDQELEMKTPELLDTWPNTYVFAKCVTEDLVKSFTNDVPIAVVRPGIIMCSKLEPLPGWVDNLYGPAAIMLTSALGLMRAVYAKRDASNFTVPVDFVVNLALTAAWYRKNTSDTKIYNYVGDEATFLNWGQYIDIFVVHMHTQPSIKAVRYGTFTLCETKFWYKVTSVLQQTIPAYIVDLVLFCLRKKPIAAEQVHRLNAACASLHYFTENKWTFDYKNVKELWNQMNSLDQEKFNFNMEVFNWKQFSVQSAFGLRKYILKEPINTIPAGTKRLKVLFTIHCITYVIWWFLIYKLIVFLLSPFF